MSPTHAIPIVLLLHSVRFMEEENIDKPPSLALLFLKVKTLLPCALLVSLSCMAHKGLTLLFLLLTGAIFSYFCMSSITSLLILAILIAIVLF